MAPFFIDGVQLPQGYSHFEEAVYFLPFSSPSSSKTRENVNLNEILKRGFWKSKHIFRTYYSRHIINEDVDFQFNC